jgi:allophanate hydrolase
MTGPTLDPIDVLETADETRIDLAVCGAHLSGQPLNAQLTDRAGELVATVSTAASYRLFALDTQPPKPGLVRVADGAEGAAIEVEVWSLDPAAFASFVDAIPAPMCIGRVVLDDGRNVAGFLCEPIALDGATDITSYGGWRAYRAAATA